MRAIRVSIALTALSFGGGCAVILGIDEDPSLVAEEFCKCGDLEAAWVGQTCTEHVAGSLRSASDEERTAWLALFESGECYDCTSPERGACARSRPVCSKQGELCGSSTVCCGDAAEVYCGANNVCSRDSAECRPTLTECTEDAECCGAGGGFALCIQPENGSKFCAEYCNPANPVNCSDCCALITNPTGTQGVCFSDATLPLGLTCDQLCDETKVPSCPAGLFCRTRQITTEATIQVCETLDAE